MHVNYLPRLDPRHAYAIANESANLARHRNVRKVISRCVAYVTIYILRRETALSSGCDTVNHCLLGTYLPSAGLDRNLPVVQGGASMAKIGWPRVPIRPQEKDALQRQPKEVQYR